MLMGLGLLDVFLCIFNVMVCFMLGYLDLLFIELMDEIKLLL